MAHQTAALQWGHQQQAARQQLLEVHRYAEPGVVVWRRDSTGACMGLAVVEACRVGAMAGRQCRAEP